MSTATVAQDIAMPRLSDSMEEGTILAWLKQVGDTVALGEELAEIETDKANMALEADAAGTLLEILVPEGEAAAVGAVIARVGDPNAEAPSPNVPPGRTSGEPTAPSPTPTEEPSSFVNQRLTKDEGVTEAGPKGRVKASPLARRLAAEMGVDLASLQGSGPGGRISKKDVLAAAPAVPAPAPAPAAPFDSSEGELLKLNSTQRLIARRMVESRSEIPDFTVSFEIDMTRALAMRRELNEAYPGARVSVNDLVLRAAAIALREQPTLNSSWIDGEILRHRRVRIGIAVASEDGALLVPAIDDPDQKTLVEIAAQSRAAGERARKRSSTPEELSGATFTVSNLGMFGALNFEAVINPPQVAILAVGGSVRRPCFDEDGEVVARDLMQASLCSDHRAVYGADAARFMARLRELLEAPLLLTQPAIPADQGGAA